VVIALEIATALALSGSPPVAPFRVVLFDAEEIGLVGSAQYAEDLRAGGGGLGCALNIDMVHATVAATAGRVWFLFDETSREHAALGAEAAAAYVTALPLITSSYATGNADQASFWDRGLCAVGMSSWPRVETNHTVDDTTATFDQEHFGRVARAAAAIVAAWAYYPPGT
jgi:Zn-dependent M28 family amino/carboxypeptidase